MFGPTTLPDGTKVFGLTTLPDGTKKAARVERPYMNREKDFDVVWLPDGEVKASRVEVNLVGDKNPIHNMFDVVWPKGGGEHASRTVWYEGNETKGVGVGMESTWPELEESSSSPSSSSSSHTQSMRDLVNDVQDPTCATETCMEAVRQHDVEREKKRLYGENK